MIDFKLRDATAKWANPAQRGFVAGRCLTQNPVDLDIAARLHGCGSARAEKPVLAFFHFSAAFPSVAHSWVYKVMEAMKIPTGIQALIRQIYTGCTAVSFILYIVCSRALLFFAHDLIATSSTKLVTT